MKTPACPADMVEFTTDCEGVTLTCHLEHTPSEAGGSMSLLYTPTFQGNLTLVSAYHQGEDIAHILLQYLVNEIEEAALTQLENYHVNS